MKGEVINMKKDQELMPILSHKSFFGRNQRIDVQLTHASAFHISGGKPKAVAPEVKTADT